MYIVALLAMILIVLFYQNKIKTLKKDIVIKESQHKSREVRMGFLGEYLAPLLKEFPYDIQREDVTIIPLGHPIDYFVISPEEIGIVEIKTGKSPLNANQRHVKKLVEDKKISWHLVRITGKP